MTFSRPRSGCGSGSGSGSVVSSAHPAIFFASSARTKASVSTTGRAAQLIRNAEGFIRENARSFIIWRVSGASGGCSETKSDSESSESGRSLRGRVELPFLDEGVGVENAHAEGCGAHRDRSRDVPKPTRPSVRPTRR